MGSELWEETDLEAEPTWPSWPGNDSKLWSFFTASCGDKHKWLSSYCFKRSNTSFVNVDKITCSVERSGLWVMGGYCSQNTWWSEMRDGFVCAFSFLYRALMGKINQTFDSFIVRMLFTWFLRINILLFRAPFYFWLFMSVHEEQLFNVQIKRKGCGGHINSCFSLSP